MTVKYVYIAPFIQKCFRDYIWRRTWQLFNSCTATLYNSLVQEVNKNSVSTRNSRGYLGRENIITQIGTCPESEDLHTCAGKTCHGSLCEPRSAPSSAACSRHAASSSRNPVFYSSYTSLLWTSWQLRKEVTQKEESHLWKHSVLYRGVHQRPGWENGLRLKAATIRKRRFGGAPRSTESFAELRKKMRASIWSPVFWILTLNIWWSLLWRRKRAVSLS